MNLENLNKEDFLSLISDSYLNKIGRLNINKLKREPEAMELFYKFTDKIPNNRQYSLANLYWCIKNNFNEIPSCKTCGKEIQLNIEYANKKYPKGYVKKYCSLKCFNNNPEIKEKAREREKIKAQERLKKRKETVKEKYGSWDNRPGKDNFKKANKKLKTDQDYKEKRIEKTKQTNLEKYGESWASKTDEFQEKRKKTNLEKYQVENPVVLYKDKSTEQIQENRIFQKYNFKEEDKKNWNSKEFWIKNFVINDKINVIKAQENFKINDYMVIYNHFKNILGDDFINFSTRSRLQDDIINFIKSISKDEVLINERKTIAPLELDIHIPERKFAIEFDGLYWHSFNQKELINEFKYKHLIKTRKAEEKDINLIHIFENEWLDPRKQDIFKSVISYKLGMVKEKYFARKLEVKEVSKEEAAQFENENHLQGAGASRIKLGLYRKDELISMMTFSKPRYNRHYDYELIRFVSKKYSNCIGCASKIFKHFIKKYNPNSIISYANRRWAFSKRNLYTSIGFKLVNESEPNYFYFKLEDMVLYPRVKFQKHKLEKLKETKDVFDPKMTETEIVFKAGYRRIYDCGQMVYEWKNKGDKND